MSSAALDAGALPAAGKTSARRRRRRLALVVAVLLAIGAAARYGYGWWTEGRFFQTTDDAYVGGDVTAIAPHVAGFVAEVLVADNQRVAAGQTLIRLDRRDFKAALDHAEAAVAARAAAIDSLRAQYSLQQTMIRQQDADLSAKAARAAFAVQDADRYRNLAQTAAGSRQDMQRSLTLDQEARAAVLSSVAGAEAARQQLHVLDAQLAEAKGALDQALSDRSTAELDLGYTEVTAPIDGYIGNRAAQVGAYVSQGAYLISVIPSSGLWVDANFKEDQLAAMAPGQRVTVDADVLPGHAFRGRVASLAPGTGAVFSVIPPENATGNFTKIVQRVPVRIALDADDDRLPMLRPGLSATVSVDTRAAP